MSRREIIEGITFDVIQVDPQDPQTALQYVEQPAKSLLLPSFDEMILNYQIFSDAVPKLLADAVAASVVRGCGHDDIELARTDGNRVSAVALFDDYLHYRSSCIVTAPEATFERPSRPSRRVSRRKTRPRRRRSRDHTLPGGREVARFRMSAPHIRKIPVDEFIPNERSIFSTLIFV